MGEKREGSKCLAQGCQCLAQGCQLEAQDTFEGWERNERLRAAVSLLLC